MFRPFYELAFVNEVGTHVNTITFSYTICEGGQCAQYCSAPMCPSFYIRPSIIRRVDALRYRPSYALFIVAFKNMNIGVRSPMISSIDIIREVSKRMLKVLFWHGRSYLYVRFSNGAPKCLW